MKTIVRKSMLYKTGVEYGNYTMNHVLGCAHGCRFPCYAFLQKNRFGQVNGYEDWIEPKLASNTLELLEAEIPRLKDKIKSVHLITLVSLDESYRRKLEPGAAHYAERLLALKALKDAGCRTWVSIEPYPTPNIIKQTLRRFWSRSVSSTK